MKFYGKPLRLGLIVLSAFAASQCRTVSSTPSNSESQASDAFPAAAILDVQLTTDPKDWDSLRFEGNDLSALVCGNELKTEYGQFAANLSIDGEAYGAVSIRKKGFLGSLLQSKPSLKIKFKSPSADANYKGLTRLVLNNNNQDPALMRQCIAYEIFKAAGIPAPRCSFARVSVNGKSLGIYTHVEEFSSSFIKRELGGKEEVLIEGTLSDFSPAYTQSFEVKNGDAALAEQKIKAVTEILNDSSGDLLAKLAAHIDLDKFFRFWATEVLVGHWDGYASNRNNYYIHINSQSGKMEFIPWGVDSVFSANDPFFKGPGVRPITVSATSKLSNRLLNDPEGKVRYVAAMRSLLLNVWNVPQLKQRLETLRDLLGSEVLDSSFATMKEYIETRGDLITQKLAASDISWPLAYKEASACIKNIGSFQANFSTKWLGDINPKTPGGGTGSMSFTVDGETVNLATVYSLAGTAASVIRSQPSIILMGKSADDTYIAQIFLEQGLFLPKMQAKFQGLSSFGALLKVSANGSVERKGLISAGSFQLEDAAKESGLPVSGRLQGQIFTSP